MNIPHEARHKGTPSTRMQRQSAASNNLAFVLLFEEAAFVENSHVLLFSDFDLCKRRILALGLPGIPEHFTESERALYFSSLVPFENFNMVSTGSLGHKSCFNKNECHGRDR